MIEQKEGAAHVAARIRESHRVVGCVAWLTHDGVLEALGSVPGGFDLVIMNDRCIKTRVLARYAAAARAQPPPKSESIIGAHGLLHGARRHGCTIPAQNLCGTLRFIVGLAVYGGG